jgi:hypothetical protein
MWINEAMDEMTQHIVFSLDNPIEVDFKVEALGCALEVGEEVTTQSSLGPNGSWG